ncbi:malonate decarboxylase subunit delta [Listeria sp. PSOL-1]|uniref:malonate decarboxylase subunit delta n=1 Tax=Listeria sp. PSOL-1 TaxID=1844999 RepID=UPI0013D70B04|nr:malonate decarboxylase subunit delta [Listeria sp. PSOL-1]
MEKLTFSYRANNKVQKKVHIGVVASGDLEILIQPTTEKETVVQVITGSDGFQKIWENVLHRFFDRYPILCAIEIHDFGATPGVVSLRLMQAVEVLNDEK